MSSSNLNSNKSYYLKNHFYADAWDIMDEVFSDPAHGHAGNKKGSKKLTKLAGIYSKAVVLDIGSGIAGMGIYLAKELKCWVTCIELSKDMNAKARRFAKLHEVSERITFVTSDVNKVNLGHNKYDFIFSLDALVQIANRQKLFEKCHRALKHAGKLAFADYILNYQCNENVVNEYLSSIASPGMETLSSYIDLLRGAGFEITHKESKKKESEKWIAEIVCRLEDNKAYFIKKFGTEEYESIHVAFSGWLDLSIKGFFTYCRIVAKKN